jgi:hypothetical protein
MTARDAANIAQQAEHLRLGRARQLPFRRDIDGCVRLDALLLVLTFVYLAVLALPSLWRGAELADISRGGVPAGSPGEQVNGEPNHPCVAPSMASTPIGSIPFQFHPTLRPPLGKADPFQVRLTRMGSATWWRQQREENE